MIADFADELDQWVIKLRANDMFEILLIGGINLRGDLQRQPGLLGNLYRPIRALLGRDPAEES